MAHSTRRLRRYNSVTLDTGKQIHFFNYATDNTAAEMLTAGYFNGSRAGLTVGSIIDAVVLASTAPDNVRCRVTAVPADGTSNITVAYDAPAAGS